MAATIQLTPDQAHGVRAYLRALEDLEKQQRLLRDKQGDPRVVHLARQHAFATRDRLVHHLRALEDAGKLPRRHWLVAEGYAWRLDPDHPIGDHLESAPVVYANALADGPVALMRRVQGGREYLAEFGTGPDGSLRTLVTLDIQHAVSFEARAELDSWLANLPASFRNLITADGFTPVVLEG
jgi:hypothetical protein